MINSSIKLNQIFTAVGYVFEEFNSLLIKSSFLLEMKKKKKKKNKMR